MTHDHGEDAAIVDAALRCTHLPYVGLIGSSAKWRRIERVLREWGHDDATTARVTTPIGDPRITGKDPATLALSVCVDLIQRLAGRAPASAASQVASAAAPSTRETTL